MSISRKLLVSAVAGLALLTSFAAPAAQAKPGKPSPNKHHESHQRHGDVHLRIHYGHEVYTVYYRSSPGDSWIADESYRSLDLAQMKAARLADAGYETFVR